MRAAALLSGEPMQIVENVYACPERKLRPYINLSWLMSPSCVSTRHAACLQNRLVTIVVVVRSDAVPDDRVLCVSTRHTSI